MEFQVQVFPEKFSFLGIKGGGGGGGGGQSGKLGIHFLNMVTVLCFTDSLLHGD